MMSSWHSYPKIYAVGHAVLRKRQFFTEELQLEAKCDGSQFSFGVFDGEIKCKSKNKQLYLEAPDKMFIQAVETVKRLAPVLHDGWTYRAEYLQKPKHNVLRYNRVPKQHLIIFDINIGEEDYLSYADKKAEADRIGLETVELLGYKKISSPDDIKDLLETESMLGGTKIEGIVCKQYNIWDPTTGKLLFAKYVSEAFKEKHIKDWKNSNPSKKDIVQQLGESFQNEAVWRKAVQHLREVGELEEDPRDIGKLIKLVQQDIEEEWAEDIKERLYSAFSKNIKGIAIRGLPEWYKGQLLNLQFEKDLDESN
jgi:hypothetical protein